MLTLLSPQVEHPQAELGATGGTRPSPHYFASTSAGKEESIVADLQTDEGKALLHGLIAVGISIASSVLCDLQQKIDCRIAPLCSAIP